MRAVTALIFAVVLGSFGCGDERTASNVSSLELDQLPGGGEPKCTDCFWLHRPWLTLFIKPLPISTAELAFKARLISPREERTELDFVGVLDGRIDDLGRQRIEVSWLAAAEIVTVEFHEPEGRKLRILGPAEDEVEFALAHRMPPHQRHL